MKRTPLNIRAEREQSHPFLSAVDNLCHLCLASCVIAAMAFLLVQMLLMQAPHLTSQAAMVAMRILG